MWLEWEEGPRMYFDTYTKLVGIKYAGMRPRSASFGMADVEEFLKDPEKAKRYLETVKQACHGYRAT